MKPDSSQIYPPGLYLVATPIGNLKDISLRAIDLLEKADLIVCEDTRVTAKLLRHYGIKKPTLSYNDHNGGERRPKIMEALGDGKRVALVSDAGTPLVSDPGYKLVQEVIESGIYVSAIPGASSVLAALCLSGLPSDRFFFAGFLPPKKEACRKEIASLVAVPSTLIFFESAQRLQYTLALMHAELGARNAAVVREITKLYEEARRDTLENLASYYSEHGAPKGEVVIVVGPPPEKETTEADLESRLRWLLQSHSVRDAATVLADQTGISRKLIYAMALKLADENEIDDE